MTCKNCGKNLPDEITMCPNCGNSILRVNFHNNKIGVNGKNSEYITEKYNMKKGIYEGKASNISQTYIGVVIVFVIVLILIAIAVANYLL